MSPAEPELTARVADLPEVPRAPRVGRIEQLTREHANISRLLTVLESELSALGAGRESDNQLILQAVRYLTEYVDGFHQALEDLALKAALQQAPELGAVSEQLAGQHARVRDTGAILRDALERALLDEPVCRQDLANTGVAYAAELRTNMDLEESAVFPVLEQALDPETWAQIEAKLGSRVDPLFGSIVAERYRVLYGELVRRFRGE